VGRPPTSDAAKALAHPLRARILEALAGEPRSPNELAVEFGEPLGNVSYHVLVLRDLGMVELVDTAPRRGAVEHFYRARWRVQLQVQPLERGRASKPAVSRRRPKRVA
jgi:DNA-binding transcriptional ArsR family regulator